MVWGQPADVASTPVKLGASQHPLQKVCPWTDTHKGTQQRPSAQQHP